MDKNVNTPIGLYRAEARQILKGNWLKAAGVVAVSYLFTDITLTVLGWFVEFGHIENRFLSALMNITNVINSEIPWRLIKEYFRDDFSYLTIIYWILVVLVLEVGVDSYFMKFTRKEKAGVWNLFDGFRVYFKSLALNLICILSIAVGGLLLIVPGFLAAYGFSQAKFILMEDPSKGVIQCIKESWVLMDGKKADLFLIHLTFIGWRALSAIPAIIFFFTIKDGTTGDFILYSEFVATLIPFVFCVAYFNTTTAVFYNILTGSKKFDPELKKKYLNDDIFDRDKK